MDANEFWCRSFLAAMGEHVRDLERCEEVANAALWRAQRRGVVTGERAASAPVGAAALRRRVIMVDDVTTEPDSATQANVRIVIEHRMADRAVGPVVAMGAPLEPERAEFTAYRGLEWWLIDVHDVGVFRVEPGKEHSEMATGAAIRIKWGETTPPRPIEVWIERR
jgi:hypothetical protein